jgi:hypothetical protein
MKLVLRNILSYVVKQLIDVNLYQYIITLVQIQFNRDLTGEEKRAAVKQQLSELTGDLGTVIATTSVTYINLAIEVAVLVIKARINK